MVTRTVTGVEEVRTIPVVLHFVDREPQETKEGHSLRGAPEAMREPIPFSSQATRKSRAERDEEAAFQRKLESLFQEMGEQWKERFLSYPARKRLICLALLANDRNDLKPLIQFMLPVGERVEDFLLVCKAGSSKYKETLAKGEALDQVAKAHFDACRSFEEHDNADRKAQLVAIRKALLARQERMRQITHEVREKITAIVSRVNTLSQELQAMASNNPDLAEAPLKQLTADYQALMSELEGLK